MRPVSPVRLWILLIVVVAMVTGAAPAPAAIVARPGAATAVREYAGTLVFSTFSDADRQWHLAVRASGAVTLIPVAPSPVPFDADIGADSKGRPELIYRRCTGSAGAPTDCDLFVYSLAAASGERPVSNANDPANNDLAPTLWRGRIAWAREYGAGKTANPVVYTKLLTAPRSEPSTRLPGVPATRCSEVDPTCGPTTFRDVTALELWGDNLGLNVSYLYEGLSGTSQTEVRLDRVSDRTARQVALLFTGLAGQHWVGPSFFDGRLAWYKACSVNEPSCAPVVGPWRYSLTARTYERGAPGARAVSGFADTGSRLYETIDCTPAEETALGALAAGCVIDSSAPPSYTAARAPTG